MLMGSKSLRLRRLLGLELFVVRLSIWLNGRVIMTLIMCGLTFRIWAMLRILLGSIWVSLLV